MVFAITKHRTLSIWERDQREERIWCLDGHCPILETAMHFYSYTHYRYLAHLEAVLAHVARRSNLKSVSLPYQSRSL